MTHRTCRSSLAEVHYCKTLCPGKDVILLIEGDKRSCFTLREDPLFECLATLIGDDTSRHHKAHGTYRTRQFPRHLGRKWPLVSVPAALLMLILFAGANPAFPRLNLTKVVLVGCCHTEILLCQRSDIITLSANAPEELRIVVFNRFPRGVSDHYVKSILLTE